MTDMDPKEIIEETNQKSPTITKQILKPHPHDVLSGRGSVTNLHIGNINFRQLVEYNKARYAASMKQHKTVVSKSIVKAIRSQNPKGRFLELDRDCNVWRDIGNKRAVLKTSQALRETPTIHAKLIDPDKYTARGMLEPNSKKSSNPPEVLSAEVTRNISSKQCDDNNDDFTIKHAQQSTMQGQIIQKRSNNYSNELDFGTVSFSTDNRKAQNQMYVQVPKIPFPMINSLKLPPNRIAAIPKVNTNINSNVLFPIFPNADSVSKFRRSFQKIEDNHGAYFGANQTEEFHTQLQEEKENSKRFLKRPHEDEVVEILSVDQNIKRLRNYSAMPTLYHDITDYPRLFSHRSLSSSKCNPFRRSISQRRGHNVSSTRIKLRSAVAEPIYQKHLALRIDNEPSMIFPKSKMKSQGDVVEDFGCSDVRVFGNPLVRQNNVLKRKETRFLSVPHQNTPQDSNIFDSCNHINGESKNNKYFISGLNVTPTNMGLSYCTPYLMGGANRQLNNRDNYNDNFHFENKLLGLNTKYQSIYNDSSLVQEIPTVETNLRIDENGFPHSNIKLVSDSSNMDSTNRLYSKQINDLFQANFARSRQILLNKDKKQKSLLH